MELLGYELSEFLTSQLVYSVIIFFIGVVLLHLATVIMNFEKRGFGKAIIVLILGSIVAFLLGFIPFIGKILGLIGFWFIIKSVYGVGWVKSIFAWLMSIVVAFFIALLFLFLLGISMFLI
jgi:hypothetical protein